MKVIILCGGMGTRIRDVADDIPKPMIPIGGYPILWHIMKYFSLYGHNDFILCLGHKGKVIKEYFLNYEINNSDFTLLLGRKESHKYYNKIDEQDWRITFAETGEKAMTGARLKRVQKYIGDDQRFLLTYGDGVGDINIDDLISFHLSHGKHVTLTGVHPPGRFGELEFDIKKKVVSFNEKPQTSAGRINGGFFVCNREIFNYLSEDENLVLEQEPIKNLIKDGQLMVYEHEGFWQPMDTAREFQLLNKLSENKQAPWIKW